MRGSGYGLGRYLVTHASASFSVFALSHLAWHANEQRHVGTRGTKPTRPWLVPLSVPLWARSVRYANQNPKLLIKCEWKCLPLPSTMFPFRERPRTKKQPFNLTSLNRARGKKPY